ncbi:SDR family oxidoreductase [Amycolatopsis sp. CA-230715]|uniref:SDR family oxidoreductase n=1 Tax=Amycolatopsis sp. CA-230715 TaxID=2745196 RepID=UPI001C02A7C0|nr:SDR family oxidoreductase [Amycolatopsis sp. CA-230715]QWF78066.1 putative oxidoreductase [Amycolatopsis sp. CA-230715]
MTLRKNIVITGASSGLGEGMARGFAAKGRNLGLCARRTDRLEKLAAELKAEHPGIEVVVHPLDVNDHDEVFKVFGDFRADLGTVDRIVVNAGLGKGQPIGTGRFDANKQTLETNLVAGLAQCEAAMQIFRDQRAGHLVVVSSFSALRGLPRNVTAYSASKAGLSALAEGIRADVHGKPIKVTTLLPGYIESEMNARAGGNLFVTKAEVGARALVKAIESEAATSYVPTLPWALLSPIVRLAPVGLLRKFA